MWTKVSLTNMVHGKNSVLHITHIRTMHYLKSTWSQKNTNIVHIVQHNNIIYDSI